MRMTSTARTAALLAAAVFVVGCTTADDGADDAPVGDAAGQVTYRNIRIEPADIEVPVGTTVTWTNEDSVRHTVTSGAPGAPDGVLDGQLAAEGDTFTFTFDEPGVVTYHCELHRAMVGTVTVSG